MKQVYMFSGTVTFDTDDHSTQEVLEALGQLRLGRYGDAVQGAKVQLSELSLHEVAPSEEARRQRRLEHVRDLMEVVRGDYTTTVDTSDQAYAKAQKNAPQAEPEPEPEPGLPFSIESEEAISVPGARDVTRDLTDQDVPF